VASILVSACLLAANMKKAGRAFALPARF